MLCSNSTPPSSFIFTSLLIKNKDSPTVSVLAKQNHTKMGTVIPLLCEFSPVHLHAASSQISPCASNIVTSFAKVIISNSIFIFQFFQCLYSSQHRRVRNKCSYNQILLMEKLHSTANYSKKIGSFIFIYMPYSSAEQDIYLCPQIPSQTQSYLCWRSCPGSRGSSLGTVSGSNAAFLFTGPRGVTIGSEDQRSCRSLDSTSVCGEHMSKRVGSITARE